MNPLPPSTYVRCAAWIVLSTVVLPSLQAQDAPPVDLNQLRQTLASLRDQQATQVKAQKAAAIQQVMAVAGSADRAAAMWEDAVHATQFDGAAKEGAQFREWREKEGDALRSKEAQNAARLFFHWLGLTLQRSAGATVKELMPAIVAYTKDVTNDQLAMEAFEENLKREKEQDAKRKPNNNPHKGEDAQVKKMHDSIINRGLAGSPVVQWLKLGDYVNVPNWEQNPGDVNGIFQKIVLPELRAEKDPRLIEYWDMRLKREADAVTRGHLSFEVDKFNSVRRPALQWSRAQELLVLGQKNKAISEMVGIIKAHPAHPDASNWLTEIEQLVAPPAPPATAPVSATVPTGAAPVTPAAQ
jgi:hypothetical protein